MCKYCEGEFIGNKPLVPLNKSEVFGIELIVENNSLYAFCQCGTKTVVEINYCPMCGKDLKEEGL